MSCRNVYLLTLYAVEPHRWQQVGGVYASESDAWADASAFNARPVAERNGFAGAVVSVCPVREHVIWPTAQPVRA